MIWESWKRCWHPKMSLGNSRLKPVSCHSKQLNHCGKALSNLPLFKHFILISGCPVHLMYQSCCKGQRVLSYCFYTYILKELVQDLSHFFFLSRAHFVCFDLLCFWCYLHISAVVVQSKPSLLNHSIILEGGQFEVYTLLALLRPHPQLQYLKLLCMHRSD